MDNFFYWNKYLDFCLIGNIFYIQMTAISLFYHGYCNLNVIFHTMQCFAKIPKFLKDYLYSLLPYSNRIAPWLTEFGPPMWQAEADTVLTESALAATAVGLILLTMAQFC